MVKLIEKTFEKRFINKFMKRGNFAKAEKMYYKILKILKKKKIKNPYHYVRTAFIKATPIMGVIKKKRGHKETIYPVYLEPAVGEKMVLKWLLKKVGDVTEEEKIKKLVLEVRNMKKGRGDIIKAKIDLYKEVRYAVSLMKHKTRKAVSFIDRKQRAIKRRKWY